MDERTTQLDDAFDAHEFSRTGAAATAAALALSACGGGSGGGTTSDAGPVVPDIRPTAQQAARFLGQAAFGGTEAQIADVQARGYSAWIESQWAQTGSQSHWDWMVANGFAVTANINNFQGVDGSLWRRLMASPDVLRQRVALALSEIFVVSMTGLPVQWRGMAVTAYMDLLSQNAFENFRTLLERVTLSPAMGIYLNMRGNQKEDAATGRQPDENYAREAMQLFTIGLYELNADGTLRLSGAQPIESYTQSTVANFARVLTGWDYDTVVSGSPDHLARPMRFTASRHSTSAKNFLGISIPAGSTDGPGELSRALDALFQHPNVGPFIGRQLIQRLVSSNPSPAYVGRVSAAFANNGAGVRGDLRAVIRAVLLDAEATTPQPQAQAGRLREPIVRLIQWGRSFNASSAGGLWTIGDTTNPSTRLGQSPLRSPSVFNFFRPGYVPPNTPLAGQSLVAPEFQLANESTLVGYANYMQTVIGNSAGDVDADYAPWLSVANDAGALFDRLNLMLAAGQLSAATRATITTAVGSMASGTDAQRLQRVQATVLLVMTAPEYLIQR